ncbi:EamA family transporter [Nocardia sp. IBHARD005]|uniref:EamA family transporter n=1 Tax=Nocardia sp. IBHARD005 TaxID=3457765 RepID=UPI004059280D
MNSKNSSTRRARSKGTDGAATTKASFGLSAFGIESIASGAPELLHRQHGRKANSDTPITRKHQLPYCLEKLSTAEFLGSCVAENNPRRRTIRYAGDKITILFLVGVVAQYVGYGMAVKFSVERGMFPVAVGRSVISGGIFVLVGIILARGLFISCRALLLGVVTALMNVMSFMAAGSLPLGVTTGIEFLGPITLAAIGIKTLKSVLVGLAALLGVAALYLRVGVPAFGNEAHIGLVFGLASATLWAIYISLGESDRPLKNTLSGFGVGLVLGGAAVATLVGITRTAPSIVIVDLAFWSRCAVIAILASVIPYAIDLYCLTKMSAQTFAVLVAALPLVSATIGWIWLDQPLGIIGVMGIVLVSASLVGLRTIRAPDQSI